MPDTQLISHIDTEKIDFNQLALIPSPPSTLTHQIIPHHEVVNALVETLGFRHIAVHKMEFAVDKTGNKMFGTLELEQGFTGARFALGLRNSHDKTMRLAMTVGYRVFVCDNLAFHGDFTPVLAKHTKNFNLTRALAYGVDDCQRNFDPMLKAVERWRDTQLSDVSAKLLITNNTKANPRLPPLQRYLLLEEQYGGNLRQGPKHLHPVTRPRRCRYPWRAEGWADTVYRG